MEDNLHEILENIYFKPVKDNSELKILLGDFTNNSSLQFDTSAIDKSGVQNKPFFTNPLKLNESKNNDASINDKKMFEKLIVFDESNTNPVESRVECIIEENWNEETNSQYKTYNYQANQSSQEQYNRTPPNIHHNKNNDLTTEETLNKTNYMFDKKINSEEKIQNFKDRPATTKNRLINNEDKEIDAYKITPNQKYYDVENFDYDKKFNEKKQVVRPRLETENISVRDRTNIKNASLNFNKVEKNGEEEKNYAHENVQKRKSDVNQTQKVLNEINKKQNFTTKETSKDIDVPVFPNNLKSSRNNSEDENEVYQNSAKKYKESEPKNEHDSKSLQNDSSKIEEKNPENPKEDYKKKMSFKETMTKSVKQDIYKKLETLKMINQTEPGRTTNQRVKNQSRGNSRSQSKNKTEKQESKGKSPPNKRKRSTVAKEKIRESRPPKKSETFNEDLSQKSRDNSVKKKSDLQDTVVKNIPSEHQKSLKNDYGVLKLDFIPKSDHFVESKINKTEEKIIENIPKIQIDNNEQILLKKNIPSNLIFAEDYENLEANKHLVTTKSGKTNENGKLIIETNMIYETINSLKTPSQKDFEPNSYTNISKHENFEIKFNKPLISNKAISYNSDIQTNNYNTTNMSDRDSVMDNNLNLSNYVFDFYNNNAENQTIKSSRLATKDQNIVESKKSYHHVDNTVKDNEPQFNMLDNTTPLDETQNEFYLGIFDTRKDNQSHMVQSSHFSPGPKNNELEELKKMYKNLDEKMNSIIANNQVTQNNENNVLMSRISQEFTKLSSSQSNLNQAKETNANNFGQEKLLENIFSEFKKLNDKMQPNDQQMGYNQSQNTPVSNSKVNSEGQANYNSKSQFSDNQNKQLTSNEFSNSNPRITIGGPEGNLSNCYLKMNIQQDSNSVCALEQRQEEEQFIRETLVKLLTKLRDSTYEKQAMKYFRTTTFYEIIAKKTPMKRLESMPLRSKLLNFLSIFQSEVENKMKYKLKRNQKLLKIRDNYQKLIKCEVDNNTKKISALLQKARNVQEIEQSISTQVHMIDNNQPRMTIKFESKTNSSLQASLFSRRLKKLLTRKDNLEQIKQTPNQFKPDLICLHNTIDKFEAKQNVSKDKKPGTKYVTISYFDSLHNDVYKQKEPDFKSIATDQCSSQELHLKRKFIQYYYSTKQRLPEDQDIDTGAKKIWEMIKNQGIIEDRWEGFMKFFIKQKKTN